MKNKINSYWRYALMVVALEEDGEPCSEIVELYVREYDDGTEDYRFAKAGLGSIVKLKMALKDAEEYGHFYWFYENGKFSHNQDFTFWNWEPNDAKREE